MESIKLSSLMEWNFLEVQWLGLCALTAKGLGFDSLLEN